MNFKKLLYILLLITPSVLLSQVGINTNNPTTDLDIVSKTTLGLGEFNGITIPKVSTIPLIVAPSGTIIYLTAVSGTNPIGFYFSNGIIYQNVTDMVNASNNGAFNAVGTLNVATNASQNIFRTGTVSVGEDVSGSLLNLTSPATGFSPRTTASITNSNNDGSNNVTYGIDLTNNSTSGLKYGINMSVSGSGNADRFGIKSTVAPANFTGRTNYGIRSDVGANTAVNSTNYGIYSEIGSAATRGTNYAIYAYSNHGTTTTDPSYSGYFRGDLFAIRSEDNLSGYDLTTATGTAGQVLTSNGAMGTSWTTIPDTSNNNEGILSIGVGGSNDSQIISTNGTNSTQITISGGNGISVTEIGSTVTIQRDINGNVNQNIQSLSGGPSGSPTLIQNGYYISLTPTSGNADFSLPNPSTVPGRTYILRNVSNVQIAYILTTGGNFFSGDSSGSSNVINMNPNTSMIGGDRTKTIILISDGVNWTYGPFGF